MRPSSLRIPSALCLLIALAFFSTGSASAQTLTSESVEGLALRSIGPTFTSGRISDVAIDPTDSSVWYVAVSSGNVWKTVNRGVTWAPIFDDYGSYSIGSVVVDPNDPQVVWIGTGENASQRSAGYGDGIYKSVDGGESWRNMGLEDSEHIGQILVDPRDSDVVYAASQGPLWSAGGDRGLYKTTDGGESWEPILQISENTGISNIEFDPRDPDVLYASSYQRRRHVGILIAGGPEGSIFKSTDAGATWTEIADGLPDVELGRIGLAVSPHDPDVVYAMVTAQHEESGFFRSTDAGATWQKRSDYIWVDPQYYGELYVDPHRPGRICVVDVTIHCTEDDGATFEPIPLRGVHADHHEIIFDPDDPDYMMVGNDGGLYETWDNGQSWLHHDKLPIIQFYRVGISSDEPFYWLYGGTQDNGTLGGPARTRNTVGIRNSDWTRIIGGDGFQARIDPENPNIVYGMSQGARIQRVDMSTGQSVSIAPTLPDEAENEDMLWHWDIPLTISRYDRNRIYALGNRLLRSDNRGDDWYAISPNLTKQIDRDTLEVMGRVWEDDAVWKHVFTNDYGIGVAFSESPFQDGEIYIGTDDGLIQRTDDGGESWTRFDRFPGVPEMIYVSEVLTSRHDPNTVYALFNNHKRGDFTPYILKSTNRGDTWTSIRANLPDRHALWTMIEDPVDPDLLFVGSEFGLFFTADGGERWTRLEENLPTIPVRDLEIHEGWGDLAVATFGRGFYVLDDYAALRFADELDSTEAQLFPVRTTYHYTMIGYFRNGSGTGEWAAENPPFGALLTYYLQGPIDGAEIVVRITNSGGTFLADVPGPNEAGYQRTAWNLRSQSPAGGRGGGPGGGRGGGFGGGPMVDPGTYTATLGMKVGDTFTALGDAQTIEVVPLPASNRE